MELTIGAVFTATILGPDGAPKASRRGHNTMCAAGLTALAQTIMWSGAEDVAANEGITGPLFLAPLWGAVGSGTQTPAATLTALAAELDRGTVSSAGFGAASGTGSASTSFVFYFPGPATAWTVTEAGLFASGSSAPGSGSMVDYWQFSPSLSVQSPDSLVLQATFTIGGV